jgi:hypothetical protein
MMPLPSTEIVYVPASTQAAPVAPYRGTAK